MSDPTWPAYPIMVFLSLLATVIPLTWIGRDNTGMIFLSLWLAVACISEFVNTIVWHGNALNSAPVWCDISTRINIAIGVSVPASALCMCRRLYRIASMKAFILTPRQKRRAIIEDLLLCLGIPALEIILQYVVSDHRYIVFEDIGCLASYFNAWGTYVLMYAWPIILGVIGGIYAVLTIYTIAKKGKQMDEILRSANIKKSHYRRVTILACCEICFATPFAIAVMTLDLTLGPLSHYKNWNYVHAQYSEIIQVPAVLWRSMGPTWIVLDELYRWMFVFLGFVFFALFGFSREARDAYGKVFWTVAKVFGIKRPEPSIHEEKTLEYVFAIIGSKSC
ncbi:fungal pheromone STE3G-protein-coupled receptor [Rickenella mellea]|uniref:Fungal pheromone STE3G-protein-coupled receptor n=1 Tax=Rickenella mellea TaxID=50990 RepID=A0A4Y7PTT2_9AGAM|nr:fungal pheromone STE3G-protein-coupled receptor [Rickenella mellea]